MFSRFITWVLSHFKSQEVRLNRRSLLKVSQSNPQLCSHLCPQKESLKQHNLQQLSLLNKNHLDEAVSLRKLKVK